MTIPRFLGIYLVFLAVLGGLPAALVSFGGMPVLIAGFWDLFVLFALFTAAILLPALKWMKISDKVSGNILLGTLALRFLFCLVVLLIFMSRNEVDKVPFTLNFFYLYLFHSVFEIYCLLRNLRNSKF